MPRAVSQHSTAQHRSSQGLLQGAGGRRDCSNDMSALYQLVEPDLSGAQADYIPPLKCAAWPPCPCCQTGTANAAAAASLDEMFVARLCFLLPPTPLLLQLLISRLRSDCCWRQHLRHCSAEEVQVL